MRPTLSGFWAVWLWVSSSLCCLGIRAQEPADEPAEYRAVVDDALREYAAKNHEEARALFHRANALFPNARTQRGLGMAQFELRNYSECIRELEAALASPVRALTGPLRAETELLLARARNFVARIGLQLDPVQARVNVDGTSWEGAHDALLLDVGDHQLVLSAPGFLPARRMVRVRGGELQTLRVKLEPAAAPGPVARPGQPAHDQAPARHWSKSPWLWLGVAVVLGGAATTTGLLLARDSQPADPYGGSAETVLVGK